MSPAKDCADAEGKEAQSLATDGNPRSDIARQHQPGNERHDHERFYRYEGCCQAKASSEDGERSSDRRTRREDYQGTDP